MRFQCLVKKYEEPKTSLKCNSSDFLHIQKKEEKNQYAKGYNAALKKCNNRACYIMNKMLEAYKKAVEEDEDCYD